MSYRYIAQLFECAIYALLLFSIIMLIGSEIAVAASEVEVVPLSYREVWVAGGGTKTVTLASESNGLTVSNAFYRASVSIGLKNGDTIQYVYVTTYFWHNDPETYGTIAISGTPVDDWIKVGAWTATVDHYVSGILSGSTRRLYLHIENTDYYAQTFTVFWRVFRVVSMP